MASALAATPSDLATQLTAIFGVICVAHAGDPDGQEAAVVQRGWVRLGRKAEAHLVSATLHSRAYAPLGRPPLFVVVTGERCQALALTDINRDALYPNVERLLMRAELKHNAPTLGATETMFSDGTERNTSYFQYRLANDGAVWNFRIETIETIGAKGEPRVRMSLWRAVELSPEDQKLLH